MLFGSPRKNGFTKKLLNEFLHTIEHDYFIKLIDSYQYNINPCSGCGVCENIDGCCYNDFDEIDYLLREADLLIIASPIYNLSFPAPLKAIFDRMQRYYSARFVRNIYPVMDKPKKAILLLTSGSDGYIGCDIMKRQVKLISTVINTKLIDTVLWNNTDSSKATDLPYQDIVSAAQLLK